jgi:hypothetical protein
MTKDGAEELVEGGPEREAVGDPPEEVPGGGPAKTLPSGVSSRVVLFSFILVSALFFSGWMLLHHFIPGEGGPSPSGGESRDHVTAEKLASFFIPFPEGSPHLLVKFDLLLRWDRMTGTRLRKDTPQVRGEIYRHLLDSARKGKDLTSPPVLEGEISKVLRKSLGLKEIDLVVDDLKLI